jgi:hypothetical protein
VSAGYKPVSMPLQSRSQVSATLSQQRGLLTAPEQRGVEFSAWPVDYCHHLNQSFTLTRDRVAPGAESKP